MEINEATQGDVVSKKYGLSWIAYIKMFFVHAFFIAGVVFLSRFLPEHQIMILVCFFAFEGVVISLTFLSMRARYVFINESGVWYHRGILPWTKGCNGIIWSDCGGASYQQGFFAFILNTYTIYITHKYTESMQICVNDIYKGKEFSGVVADYMHQIHNQTNQKGE